MGPRVWDRSPEVKGRSQSNEYSGPVSEYFFNLSLQCSPYAKVILTRLIIEIPIDEKNIAAENWR